MDPSQRQSIAPSEDDLSSPVLSKDTPVNPTHNTWLRIFVPRHHPPSSPLPLILYIHGGGFIYCSAATSCMHHFCARMAADAPAAVLSLDYRLAPTHPLPAAYHDALDALLWARDQALNPTDPWLTDRVDWSRSFLMGCSAGANIAYHAAILAQGVDLGRMRLAGLILDQPFFGGVERTGSELRLAEDPVLPLSSSDVMWEMALPRGATRDHEYCNPMKAPMAARGLPRCLVRGFEGDPLIDRQTEAARMLEGLGVTVVARLGGEGFHGVELVRPDKLEALLTDVREFVRD